MRTFRPTSNDSWGTLPKDIKFSLRRDLIVRDGFKCSNRFGFGCEAYDRVLSIDHIIPISRGGPVCDLGNLQLLCTRCHNKKTILENKIDVRKRLSSAEKIAALNLPDEI